MKPAEWTSPLGRAVREVQERARKAAEVAIVGLDVGQAPDPSALVVLRRTGLVPAHYGVTYLRRWALGSAYGAMVAEVAELLRNPALAAFDRHLVVDATGVGRPIVELLEGRDLEPVAVTITGGYETTAVAKQRAYHVPRRDLISAVQVLLQGGRLRIAEGLAEGPQLLQELLSLRRRLTDKGETFEPEGAGAHDDMALALALASWFGEYVLGDVYEKRASEPPEPSIPLSV